VISIKSMDGKNIQKNLLQKEGIEISERLEVDLDQYLWEITSFDQVSINSRCLITNFISPML
jgi:hypothetical protein